MSCNKIFPKKTQELQKYLVQEAKIFTNKKRKGSVACDIFHPLFLKTSCDYLIHQCNWNQLTAGRLLLLR